MVLEMNPKSHIFVVSWFYASLNRNNNTSEEGTRAVKGRELHSSTRQQKTSRKEGHCRYLALTNYLIYDRFIKHQNYVNKPLKTINCCKNCASTSPLTHQQPVDSSKMQRRNIVRLFLSFEHPRTFHVIAKATTQH